MLGTISTGAVDDIRRATLLARRMVTEFGMSEKLGSVRYAGDGLRYLGGTVGEGSDCSPETRQTIDAEVSRIIGEQADRAEGLLGTNRDVLSELATCLLGSESLDGSKVLDAVARSRSMTADRASTVGPRSMTSPDELGAEDQRQALCDRG